MPPLVLPDDEENRRLVAQVHPPGWTNPTPSGAYDLVVVGAGTAGLVSAAGGAGLGARVALVERHLLGGDCLNVAAVLSWATLIGMDLSAFPKTQAWLGRCTARPGYARLISKMG